VAPIQCEAFASWEHSVKVEAQIPASFNQTLSQFRRLCNKSISAAPTQIHWIALFICRLPAYYRDLQALEIHEIQKVSIRILRYIAVPLLGTCLALWSSRCPLRAKSCHGFHGFH
jgi:hypothetical protein